MTLTMLRRGDRVTTPLGPGTVMFVRMAPPDFATVEAASVRLDSKSGDPSYVGTMFGATDIVLVKPS